MIGVALYFGVSILIGGICCFFGKKLYFPVLAAVIFFSVSGQIATNGEGNRITVAALVIGAVTAWLAVSLYKLGVFLLGALLGAGLGVMVLGIFHGDDFPIIGCWWFYSCFWRVSMPCGGTACLLCCPPPIGERK